MEGGQLILGRVHARHVLLGAVALISLVAVAALAWDSRRVIDDLRVSVRLVQANETAERALRLSAATAMERGITSILLASPPVARDEGMAELRRQRAITDRHYTDVLSAADAWLEAPPLETLRARQADFARARRRADRTLQGDSPIETADWIAASNAYIESAADLRTAALKAFDDSNGLYRHNVFLKEVFFTATEFAGRERALVGTAIAAGRALDAEELRLLERYRGIVELSLEKVAVEVKGLPHPTIQAAYREMQRTLWDDYERLRQSVYADAARGTYPVGALRWYSEATRAINAVLFVSDVVSRHVSDEVRAVRHDAIHAAIVLLVVLVVVILAFGFAYRAIHRRILLPLRRLQSAALWLSQGEFDRSIPPLAEDEFGDLAAALERMRIGIVADMRARECASRELRKLARAIDQSLESIVITDKHRVIEYVNAAFERIRGYRRGEVIGRNARIFRSGQSSPGDYARLRRAIENGDVFEGVLKNRRADGTLYFEELTITPIRDSGGEITHYVANGRDVTDRVRAEEELRKLSQAIEHSVSSVIITDRAGRVEYVNPRFTLTTGFLPQEVIGHGLDRLTSEPTPKATYRALWRTLTKGQTWEGELQNRKKSGELYWELVSISPVIGAQGEITHFISIQHDITPRKEMEEKLNRLAYFDELTGLPNRALLQDRFRQAVAHSQRRKSLCALLFVDLDRFKIINDSMGHRAGDRVIAEVARRLTACIRGSDTTCRYGGDEFLVLLSSLCDPAEAGRAARRMLDAILQPIRVDGRELRVTGSIGIALHPSDGQDLETLQRNADAAMYRAKEKGRNGFEFYIEELNREARARLELESQLRRALESEHFSLHYQPQVDLSSGRIVGMEALIRWQSAELGTVAPSHFIPVAVEAGLIVPIGEWVLRTACRQAGEWMRERQEPFTLSINVSARQLEDPRFMAVLEGVLRENALRPSHIELEITESEVMRRPDEMRDVLRALKRLGVRLAIDDFGTGYSSLGHLRRFPFDRLKIDRSFVQNIPSQPDEAAIAATIGAIARTLQLEVVAEGVETEAQACYLHRHGCRLFQGFLFGGPVPREEADRLLRNGHPAVRLPCVERSGQKARAVLCVDDDASVLDALSTLLKQRGYGAYTTTCVREALELLATQPIGMVIADQRLREMQGAEFLRRVKVLYPETQRLLLTGPGEGRAMTEGGDEGWGCSYLVKPWESGDLLRRVEHGVGMREGSLWAL